LIRLRQEHVPILDAEAAPRYLERRFSRSKEVIMSSRLLEGAANGYNKVP
jgi:hypothetical protein